jgi:excisionase family DNA binding protein
MSEHPFKASGAPPSADPDQLLNFAEGCAFLHMSKRWTWEQVKNGSLPHLRCGRAIRFRRSALVEWCAQRERATGHGAAQ